MDNGFDCGRDIEILLEKEGTRNAWL
jgi:hypothetical protein